MPERPTTTVNSFGSFLETVQGRQHAPPPHTPDVESRVLSILVEAPVGVAEIVHRTGAPLAEVLKALRELREFGLIKMVGDVGQEQVVPTPSGVRTAGAIR